MADSDPLRDRIGQIDGGELTCSTHAFPYSITFPLTSSTVVVYTTKDHAARRLLASPADEVSVGMIGRYGLPGPEDVPGIRDVVGDRRLLFLGDCDPFDLLVFAWLRQHLPIRYAGTSDSVVSALGVQIKESMTIALSAEEQIAMSLVRELLPNLLHIYWARLFGVTWSKSKDRDGGLGVIPHPSEFGLARPIATVTPNSFVASLSRGRTVSAGGLLGVDSPLSCLT